MSTKKTQVVVVQNWTESERGWGQRPDGFSIHLTMADRDAFIKVHNDRLPKDHVPDEYSFADVNAVVADAGKDTMGQLKAAKKKGSFGVWGEGRSYSSGKVLP